MIKKQSPSSIKIDRRTPIYILDGVVHCAIGKINDQYYYTEKELGRIIAKLEKENVEYEVEEIVGPVNIEITKGIKYSSVEEALEHIENAIAPESVIIPWIKDRLTNTEDWVAATLTELQSLAATVIEKTTEQEIAKKDLDKLTAVLIEKDVIKDEDLKPIKPVRLK